jgi:hypothetical protein
MENAGAEQGAGVGAFVSRAIALSLVVVMLAAIAFGQVLKRPHEDASGTSDNQAKVASKKSKRGPRAIAVIEFLPGGAARLVPVALWIDDRFYDASLYGANPEPMAVEPETVYEATNYGEPLGLFTITTPEEMKGNWIAAGKWKPHQALDEKLAAQAAKQPKTKAANPDDERPTLRRPGSTPSPPTGNSSNSNGSGSASTASPGTSSAAEEDPNRPTLKKPPEPAPTASSSSSPSSAAISAGGAPPRAASPDEYDPNRPVLRRGKPEADKATGIPVSAPANAPTTSQSKPGVGSMAVTKSFPAVSDAGPYETRSLLYAMNPEERTAKTEQMSALALSEIQKFIAERHTPALPKASNLTDYDLRAYDLEFSNSPTLVFTAKLPVPGAKAFRGGDFDYFVTFVAREDINGTPIKIFSSVTDSNHLDAFPRMEIIDAVDADANGRGDLLFRQHSDTGVSYSLYRVYPYAMQKVFEGGSSA